MSYSIFPEIFKASALTSSETLVLLVLADCSKEDGTSIYPSVATICNRTRLSDRCVRSCLSSLVKKCVLEIVERTFNSPTVYKIIVDKLKSMASNTSAPHAGGMHLMQGGMHHVPGKDDVRSAPDAGGYAPRADEPLINPFINNKYIYPKNDFSEKTEAIQKPETPSLEEQIIIKPENPVEVKKTSQPALPFPTMEAEKKPPKAKTESKETRINPDMELTSERIQIALDQGFDSSWVKDEFYDEFKVYYLKPSLPKSKAFHVDWDLTWKNWCKKAIEFNTSGTKTKPHPVKSSINLETSGHGTNAPVKQAVEDENLNKFLENNPNLEGLFAFSGATMRKVGNEITIFHPSQFFLDKMEMHSWRLKEFFKVSKIEFTTETVKKPVLVWPPKESVTTPVPDTDIQTSPTTEIKPPRYRTLNESYQGSTAKSLGANLNALQRSYHQKLQITG